MPWRRSTTSPSREPTQFHGDLYEIWNGSLFNAEDYFLHANDTPGNIAKKPRSVVNEFGVSVGGPIRRDKLFFFAHYEGIRIALPIVTSTTLPTPAYQQYVLGQLATGGYDPVTGTNLPAQPAEIPFYKNMFSLLPRSRRVAGGDHGLPAGRIRESVARSANRHAARRQRLCEPSSSAL